MPRYDDVEISLPITMGAVEIIEQVSGRAFGAMLETNEPTVHQMSMMIYGALKDQGTVTDGYEDWARSADWPQVIAVGTQLHQDCVGAFSEVADRTGFLAWLQERALARSGDFG